MGKIHRKSFQILFLIPVAAGIAFSFATTSVPMSKCAYADMNSGYIVMEGDRIIKGENYRVRMPMASTTKIMTALLLCENCLPDEKVIVPDEGVGIEGSSMYLQKGEEYTVKELLLGLMLRSGNDCAVTLALYMGGSVKNFVDMMNLRAESLGLSDTHFENPNGLHHDNHYTTCYDLCKLGQFALKNPLFAEIVSTKLCIVGKGDYRKTLKNKNKILFEYDGGNGVKTGYTKKAGRCLVSSAKRENRQLVAVCLNVPDMFGLCKNLLDYGFSQKGA